MRKVAMLAAALMALATMTTTAEAIGFSYWANSFLRMVAKAKLKGDKSLKTIWDGDSGTTMVGSPGSAPLLIGGPLTLTAHRGFDDGVITTQPEMNSSFVFPVISINGPETKASCRMDMLNPPSEANTVLTQTINSFIDASGGAFLNDSVPITQTLPLTTTYDDITSTRDTFTKLKCSGGLKAFDNFSKVKGKVKYSGKGTIEGQKFKITILVIVQGDRQLQ